MNNTICSRRSFLIGSSALGLGTVAGRVSAALPSVTGKPNLKVGIMSDVHFDGQYMYTLDAVVGRPLKYFRSRNVDAVLIAGDVANAGRVIELEAMMKKWREVFPDNKGAEGQHVELILVSGNHEFFHPRKDWVKDGSYICEDPAAVWKRVVGEDYPPVFSKTVKGYTFVCSHWPGDEGPKELAAFMEKVGPTLPKGRPFFYAQHGHPYDTCYGAWAWGADRGLSTEVLSRYPNAVAFSGHSHYSLTDERSIWQGAFTSIGTASTSYAVAEYFGRENARFGWYRNRPYDGWTRPDRKEPLMPKVGNAHKTKQCQVMSVYDDRLVFERHEIESDSSLGEDWVVPLPFDPATAPYAYARRAAGRTAPEFDAGAKAEVVLDEKARTATVGFPAAKAKGGCRVFEYEVTCECVQYDLVLVLRQARVMAEDFHFPPTKPVASGSCVFSLDELPPKANVRFAVRPMECFGKKGAPVFTEAVELPKRAEVRGIEGRG